MVVQDEFKVGFGRRRESKRWHISASPSLSPVIADTDKTPATAALHTRDAQVYSAMPGNNVLGVKGEESV